MAGDFTRVRYVFEEVVASPNLSAASTRVRTVNFEAIADANYSAKQMRPRFMFVEVIADINRVQGYEPKVLQQT